MRELSHARGWYVSRLTCARAIYAYPRNIALSVPCSSTRQTHFSPLADLLHSKPPLRLPQRCHTGLPLFLLPAPLHCLCGPNDVMDLTTGERMCKLRAQHGISSFLDQTTAEGGETKLAALGSDDETVVEWRSRRYKDTCGRFVFCHIGLSGLELGE